MPRVKGIQGVSLLDYPDKICTTLFLEGCNFRCPFCHNPELVEINDATEEIIFADVLKKIEGRKNFIEGICITGGEPLLNDGIIDFVKELKKDRGLPIKIDTNGYNPALLKRMIEDGLMDFVAMDIKTSMKKYYIAAGTGINEDFIKESIEIILNSSIPYEFRTTVVPEVVSSDDIREIGSLVNGAKKYALQQFRNEKVLSSDFNKVTPYRPEEIKKFKDILLQFVEIVEIRGI